MLKKATNTVVVRAYLEEGQEALRCEQQQQQQQQQQRLRQGTSQGTVASGKRAGVSGGTLLSRLPVPPLSPGVPAARRRPESAAEACDYLKSIVKPVVFEYLTKQISSTAPADKRKATWSAFKAQVDVLVAESLTNEATLHKAQVCFDAVASQRIGFKWDIVKEVLGLSSAITMFTPGTLRMLEVDGEDDTFE